MKFHPLHHRADAPLVSAERREHAARVNAARIATIARLRELLDITLDFTPAGSKIDALRQLLKLAGDLMPKDEEFAGIRRRIETELEKGWK